jgi:dienelactone hydrolase
MESEEFRDKLLECLGGDWLGCCPLESNMEDCIQRDGYRIEKVSYQVELGERVSAYVLIPDHVSAKFPAPGIAVWHQHNNNYALGKSEPTGLLGDPQHFTGVALALEGYVVFCPDALCFEERQDPDLLNDDFERFSFLKYVVEGKCLAWKHIWDMKRGLDYLCSRADIKKDQIGCYGHSLGSQLTWLIGPWEKRLKCLVGNCCLPTYEAVHQNKLLHGFSLYIPGLKKIGDTPSIAALIAPRPLHLNFGMEDDLSPISEVQKAMALISQSYRKLDAEEKFSYLIEEDQGHVLSEKMWHTTRSKFLKYLPLTKQ